MKRQLIKKDKEITTKHMKICSTLYGIKELQIKTMLCHHILLRLFNPSPTKQKLINGIASGEETYSHCCSEWKMVQSLRKSLAVSYEHMYSYHTVQHCASRCYLN